MAISAPKFADAVHAARYATKYLIKAPSEGFPDWVMDMGDETRIRRYSASKGFWETTANGTSHPTMPFGCPRLSRDATGWDVPFSDEGAWSVPVECEATAPYAWIGWY
jgi:hypothetical protein